MIRHLSLGGNALLKKNTEEMPTFKKVFSFFIPQYDELALFAMSVSCLLLTIDKLFTMKWALLTFDFSVGECVDLLRLLFIALFFITGLFLSLYHAFARKEKDSVEKFFMLFFAVIINAVSGISAASYAFDQTNGWEVIFPIMNLLNSGLLLVLFRLKIIDIESIKDENVPVPRVLISLIVITIIYIVSSRFYNHPWAITFSACIFYATNLNKMIPDLLVGRTAVKRQV